MTDKLSREELIGWFNKFVASKYWVGHEAVEQIKSLLTPVPEDKVDELIEKKSKEWLTKRFTPKWLFELLDEFAHVVIKEYDNLREGKEG